MAIKACPLPETALLNKYRAIPDAETAQPYTDCYSTDIGRQVDLPEFVFAFYTTPVFRLERIILKWLVSKPSTDQQARQLLDGDSDTFAAWTVEQRAPDQLLMCDYAGRTRSWFMVAPAGADRASTRLWFGSAVVPRENARTRKLELGAGFNLLLGFHKLYSRVLLRAAKKRLVT